MPYKHSFEFRNLVPGEQPLTKFGGQPNWIDEPQWPLSRQLGKPMRFICQIELPKALFAAGSGDLADLPGANVQLLLDLFPSGPRKVAYLFITDDEASGLPTSEPYGGENAVILQPGGPADVACQAIATGPTLQLEANDGGMDGPQNAEFGLTAWESEDPQFMTDAEHSDLPDEERDHYYRACSTGHKIGGTPGFIQFDEFPDSQRKWHLLLQFDTAGVPFHLELGDLGVGYLFIDSEATEGRFLWQCT